MVRYDEETGWHDQIAARASEFLGRVTDDVRDDAKRVAPVDTGALRQSIRSSVSGGVGRVGSDLDYSVWVEEGHRVAYRDSNGEKRFTGTFVPGQSYLRAALYTTREY